MRIKTLLILVALLVACSPKTTSGTPLPLPVSTRTEPAVESPLPSMTSTQTEPSPAATSTLPDLSPSATATLLLEITPADLTLTGNPVMDKILASFSKGPHAQNMQCERCHSVEAGLVTRKLTWVDDSSGLVETVKEPKQVCLKCHDYLSMESSVMLEHPGFECIHCHDAHRPQPTCAASACH